MHFKASQSFTSRSYCRIRRLIDKLTCHFFPDCAPHFERMRRWSRKHSYDQVSAKKINSQLWVAEYDLAIQNPQVAGKTLAWISDLHWNGDLINHKVLEGIESYLKNNPPHYLLLGGDLVADSINIPDLEQVTECFSKLSPKVFAISGNWEIGKRWLPENFWRDFYARHGIVFLNNEVWHDDTIAVYGIPDLTNLVISLPKERFLGCTNIIMTHSPDTIIALDRGNELEEMNLALCGHTHGGQIRLPWIGAGYVPSYYHRRFDYGLFEHKKFPTKFIVSSGVGELSCKWRIHCRRELTIVRFKTQISHNFLTDLSTL